MWFKKWKEKRRARKAGREAINMNETTRDIQSPPETRYTEDYKEYIDSQYGGAPADNSIPLREMPSGEETKNEVRMDNNINVAALKNLLERRSIRKYDTERQVPKELLDTVLLAGQYAPTAMGKQSPKIVVVQNKEVRDCISEMNDEVWGRGIDPFYGAPTIIVVFADSNIPTYVQDGSLVLGNMMNAAHAVGLGSCWINRAKEVFLTEKGKELMAKWGLGENYIGVGNLALGFAVGDDPKPAPRKEDYIVFDE